MFIAMRTEHLVFIRIRKKRRIVEMELNLNLAIPDDITVIGVKLNMVCNKCHRSWGVFLRDGWVLPSYSTYCQGCGAGFRAEEKKDVQTSVVHTSDR
jgi:hypothetical protein